MISQFLYVSTAPSLSRADVDAILEASARNNPPNGVTGLLLYNGRNFLQFLEGDHAELVALMGRIGKDPRHSGVSILHSATSPLRACPDWAMKRIPIAESVSERKADLDRDLPLSLEPIVRQMMLNFAVLN